MFGKSSLIFAWAVAAAVGQEKPLPKFEDFKVVEVFKGTPAVPILSTPHQRSFRTRIREAAAKGPNFAGYYSIAEWGCGSNCAGTAMVDVKTGRAFDQPSRVIAFPPMFEYTDDALVPEALAYKIDSRLLVVHGCPEEEKECASFYYEWTGAKFKLLRKLPAKPRQ